MFSKIFHKKTAQQTPPQSPPPQQPPPRQPPHQSQPPPAQEDALRGRLVAEDINPRVTVHYGIPSTASTLAFDPIQGLLAIGTLDGRIKVIGGDNIEALLISPKPLPFKYLEFLRNQGFLVSISNGNEIQVWDLEHRQIASSLQWESSITAFSVIDGLSYMYVGDEYGMVSVLKYDADEVKLLQMPYYVPTDAVAEASGTSSPSLQSVVGILPQPSSEGTRLLIAYQDGLIILWDVSEDKVIVVKGNKDLQLKRKIASDSHKDMGNDLSDDISEYESVEKEISSLCWASTNGSILAVGYVDGDIIFWNISTTAPARNQQTEKLSNDVVKLQLSSGERRLPVIVLHWSPNQSHNDCVSQLFVYGGDAIGSEEVLTILSLDWSSGIESLKCIGRLDLTLDGSFADMVLLPRAGVMETSGTLVLTNPGQLHFYDDACSSFLFSQQERGSSVSSMQYPMFIPTIEPYITAVDVGLMYRDGKLSRAFSEAISSVKEAAHASGSTKWPLTGGIPSPMFYAENYQVERLYIAGYQDGSVKIWDGTCPTFSLIYSLGPEVEGVDIASRISSVSALSFCPITLSLAIGNELGMVRLYKLLGNTEEKSVKVITETEQEVHMLHQVDGPQCVAVFSILNSPVCALQFSNAGTRLAVGFHCGRAAMLDASSLSVLFMTDRLSDSSSPVNSLAVIAFSDTVSITSKSEDSESKSIEDQAKWELIAVTKDAHIVAVDGNMGSVVCSESIQPEKELSIISMHIIDCGNLISEVSTEKHSFRSSQNNEAKVEPAQAISHHGTTSVEVGLDTPPGTSSFGERVDNYLILLCSEDALLLYSLKSLKEGDINFLQKVNLLKPCCWTTTFKKNDKECGLVVLYQTGVVEIRSLPDLEVVVESSLMSVLRWNFKTNMQKIICSSDSAQIMLVNGCEFASVSLLANENGFRIPESLPCLHDKVLAAAAAADAIVSLSPSQKRIQGQVPGILGGFIKGFRAGEGENNADLPEGSTHILAHLEGIFSYPPYLKPSIALADDQKVVELNIDDIDIDGPVIVTYPSEKSKNDARDKKTQRESLFEGATSDSNPRARTIEEIKAKYRKEDASAAASRARDKLAERGEKLERLSQRTAELQSGAENFASMAEELARQMEKRKWWNI